MKTILIADDSASVCNGVWEYFRYETQSVLAVGGMFVLSRMGKKIFDEQELTVVVSLAGILQAHVDSWQENHPERKIT